MPYHSSFNIKNAVRHIKAGAVIAYPTEAVFGLGCDPLNENAVMSLLDIKQRPIEKGLILIAASLEQLRPYLILDQAIIDRIAPTWPGPITWAVPARDWVPKWLTGEHQSLAIRVTNHPVAHDLCAEFNGPLVSTSANHTNQRSIKESRKLLKVFGNSTIFIVHGKVGKLDQETAIYDALSGKRLR